MSASAAPAPRALLPPTGRTPPSNRITDRNTEITTMHHAMPASARLHQEALQFRVILALTYPFFLIAAVAQRVMPTRERAASRPRVSVLREARTMAVSAIPFAFMG